MLQGVLAKNCCHSFLGRDHPRCSGKGRIRSLQSRCCKLFGTQSLKSWPFPAVGYKLYSGIHPPYLDFRPNTNVRAGLLVGCHRLGLLPVLHHCRLRILRQKRTQRFGIAAKDTQPGVACTDHAVLTVTSFPAEEGSDGFERVESDVTKQLGAKVIGGGVSLIEGGQHLTSKKCNVTGADYAGGHSRWQKPRTLPFKHRATFSSTTVAAHPALPLRTVNASPGEQALWCLCFIAVALSGSISALLLSAIPTLQALKKAAESVERLADTAREELPGTMAALRLSGMEISDLTMELSDLSQDIGEGLRSSARAVQAAEDGLRRMGSFATNSTLTLLQAHAVTLPVEVVKPAANTALETTRQALDNARKMLEDLAILNVFLGWANWRRHLGAYPAQWTGGHTAHHE